MKVCEYCRTKATDNTIKCGSCGGTEFSNICVNCSTTFSGTKCPNCGVDVGEKPRTCPCCGTKTFSVVCPKCGADLLHKEPPVQNQHIIHNVTTINISQRSQYASRKTNGGNNATIGLTFFAIIIISIFIALALKGNEKIDIQNNITDISLLTLANHPKFFGDSDKANEFYKGYRKVNVDTPANAVNDTKSLLTMAQYYSNEITYISINFSTSEEFKQGLTIDDVLKVVCEYVPFDILDQNYSFKEALYLTREDKGELYYYAMRLNDVKEERSGYLNDKLFIIKIVHSSDNNWFVYMEEDTDDHELDKIIRNYSRFEEWEINLKSYQ